MRSFRIATERSGATREPTVSMTFPWQRRAARAAVIPMAQPLDFESLEPCIGITNLVARYSRNVIAQDAKCAGEAKMTRRPQAVCGHRNAYAPCDVGEEVLFIIIMMTVVRLMTAVIALSGAVVNGGRVAITLARPGRRDGQIRQFFQSGVKSDAREEARRLRSQSRLSLLLFFSA